MYQGEEKYIQGFGKKRGGIKPLGRRGHRWENNISVGLKRNKMTGHGLDSSGST